MTDLAHVSINNDSLTFGIAIDKKSLKPKKTKLQDLIGKAPLAQIRHKIHKIQIYRIIFYYIKKNNLLDSYIEQIKKLDKTKCSIESPGYIKTERAATKDMIVAKLTEVLNKLDTEKLDKDVLQEWISRLSTKQDPPTELVQSVCKWNKFVEEKNQVYGGARFVPFEL